MINNKKFISRKDILNENFGEEDQNQPPVDNMEGESESDSDTSTEGKSDGADNQDGPQPEVIKVYTDSEEDMKELVDAGILQEGDELPEDGFYIKIKTLEGTEETLLFTEKDPSARIPVEEDEENKGSEDSPEEGSEDMPEEDPSLTEGLENEDHEDMPNGEEGSEDAPEGEEVPKGGRFDTELCSQHGDNEYCIAAEIEVTEDGEVEDLDLNKDEESGEPDVKVEDSNDEEDHSNDEDEDKDSTPPSQMHESIKVMDFKSFLNRK